MSSQNLVPSFGFQMLGSKENSLHNPCRRGVVDLRVDLNLVAKGKSTPYGYHQSARPQPVTLLAELTHGKFASAQMPLYNGIYKHLTWGLE